MPAPDWSGGAVPRPRSAAFCVAALVATAFVAVCLVGGGPGTAHPPAVGPPTVVAARPATGPGDSVIATIPVPNGPEGADYDSGKGELFVASSTLPTHNVSAISDTTNTVTASVPVGVTPVTSTYDSGKGEIFVCNLFSGNVSVVSDANNSVVATIAVPPEPIGAAYDAAKGEIFVPQLGTGNVTVISDSNNSIVASVPVGRVPVDALYDPGLGEVFVLNSGSNNLSVITDRTNSVVASIPVGKVPSGAALDPNGGRLYVTNSGSDNMSVVSTSSNAVTATIGLGNDPIGVAFDGPVGQLLVAEHNASAVSVVSTATRTIVETVGVGSGPIWVVYDPGNGRVYVTNQLGNSVSVISAPATYAVTFTESGLPGGSNWSVTLNGSTQYASATSIGFTVPNGTYAYAVGRVANYTATPNASVVVVNGSAVPVAVTFSAVTYPVTFQQTGLASGVTWSVAIGGQTGSSAGGPIVFRLPNGSSNYRVLPVSGYTADPTAGPVAVEGAGRTVNIAFTPSTSNETFVVEFTETGLPNGTTWSVTIGSAAIGAVTRSSTGPEVVFEEGNGSYTFVVGAVVDETVSPGNGSLTVAGHGVTTEVTFAPSTGRMSPSAPAVGAVELEEVAAGVVVLVVVVAVAGVLLRRRRRGEG